MCSSWSCCLCFLQWIHFTTLLQLGMARRKEDWPCKPQLRAVVHIQVNAVIYILSSLKMIKYALSFGLITSQHVIYICEYPVINLPLRLNIALKRREILACVVLYQSCKTSWVWQAETRYPANTRPWNVCTCAQVWPVVVREMSPRSSTDRRSDLRKWWLKCSLHVALPSPLASFLLWGEGRVRLH